MTIDSLGNNIHNFCLENKMQVIKVRNVHDALPEGLYLLNNSGYERKSRGGDVIMANGPVTTVYGFPQERVIFWPLRNANPFFHFMEGLWMLDGRNDVEFLAKYNSKMIEYSDNGITFHGAYGNRWKNWFGYNQLEVIAETLRNNKEDRRSVLSMWDASEDLGKEGKDFPCNLQAVFSVNNKNELDMTIYNRSNDIIWGAYGANAVHFSMLQEVMAAWVGVKIGRYWQVSNNYHAYKDIYQKQLPLMDEVKNPYSYIEKNPYSNNSVKPFPMVNTDINIWFEDLHMFMVDGPIIGFRDIFFRRVVTPIYYTWEVLKDKKDKDRFKNALEIIDQCSAKDWKLAIQEWIQRRIK